MVPDDYRRQRVFHVQPFELKLQGFCHRPGANTGGIKLLDNLQNVIGVVVGAAHILNDLIEAGFKKTVTIQVAYNITGDFPFIRVQLIVGKLPLQVGGKTWFFRDKVELAGSVLLRPFPGERELGFVGVGVFIPVGFSLFCIV